MSGKIIDLVGRRFGRLTVSNFSHSVGTRYYYNCLCDCGNSKTIRYDALTDGRTKSCGCLQKELAKIRCVEVGKKQKHGHSVGHKLSPIYNSWMSMKRRCTYTKYVGWKRYGGRGIKVCDRWMKFENFLEDMKERPDGMTLDRIDSDGDYTPENCKWSTPKEQSNNRRNNRKGII
jgi:hypothetical protein